MLESLDKEQIMLPAAVHAGGDAADWIGRWAAARQFSREPAYAMRLCVEEFVTNLITHGLKGELTGHMIALAATAKPGEVWVEITDDGAAFDIERAADPGREGTIEEATIGGRGIRLIRRFADRVEWRRLGDRNHTTLIFRT
jgi:anti-sigma regulatory factor (Ser/Thr protein kinase)